MNRHFAIGVMSGVIHACWVGGGLSVLVSCLTHRSVFLWIGISLYACIAAVWLMKRSLQKEHL